MHFFFEYPEAAAPSARPTIRPEKSAGEPPPPAEVPTRLASRHPPFVKRQCQNCHVRGMGQQPRPDFMAACAHCHQQLFAYHRFGHAPVVAQDCRFCHFMHVSPYKRLLKKSQAELCTSCHPAQQDKSALTSYHRQIESLRCTACHDPHFADNQLLLKPEEVRRQARPSDEGGAGR